MLVYQKHKYKSPAISVKLVTTCVAPKFDLTINLLYLQINGCLCKSKYAACYKNNT